MVLFTSPSARAGQVQRVIRQSLSKFNPLQCLCIRHISETERHHDPAERVKRKGKALQRRVHLKQDRRQMVLNIGGDSDTRQPCVNLEVVLLHSVQSGVAAVEATAKLAELIGGATEVVILTRKQC